MKVGSLVYATNQGLGILCKSFYDHGVLTDVLIVEHAHWPTHADWYPHDSPCIPIGDIGRRRKEVLEFCKRQDIMFFFETPFDWQLLAECKTAGVKTVLMPMYECMPSVLPMRPDLIINPSDLDQRYYPDGIHIPIPVAGIEWKERTRARVFVHNAGHLGLRYRNGTGEVLDAMKYVQSPIKLILRSQKKLPWDLPKDDRIHFTQGTVDYKTLMAEGDVFLFPEKFNGLSLPLQEAFAAGMLVMCGHRFPMTQWLPHAPLIPVKSYVQVSVSARCNMFDEALISPQDIAAKIDEFYGRDITSFSDLGKHYREAMSWGMIKPLYMHSLEKLMGN